MSQCTDVFHAVKCLSWEQFVAFSCPQNHIVNMGLAVNLKWDRFNFRAFVFLTFLFLFFSASGNYFLQTNKDTFYSKGVFGTTYVLPLKKSLEIVNEIPTGEEIGDKKDVGKDSIYS